MAHYCIGDVQGCFSELMALLEHIKFDEQQDTLWFTGDLVNRGPQSLETLRFVKALGKKAITVLGNHDLHLLAVVYGKAKMHAADTLTPILAAADCEQLCDWLRHQPMLYHDAQLGYTLVHAGLPPQWDLEHALRYAHEVELVLQGDCFKDFLAEMYGNEPNCWSDALTGYPRLRVITNYLTRLRFCDAAGALELATKTESHLGPAGYFPWFSIPDRQTKFLNILFGHWAALKGHTNHLNVHALDTGCIWGNCLTAMRLEDGQRFSVACSNQMSI
jgi:bis(5'-nucleosyl)-tetraphosphatase (symmetrical)